MSDKPQVPRPEDIVGAGIDAFVGQRPAALSRINSNQGPYAQIFRSGFRAQSVLALRRLSDECTSARVATASGDALRQLVQSEFGAIVSTDPTYAIGEVVLTRSAGTYPAGTIPKGARFKRSANPTGVPAYSEARYKAIADTPIVSGQTTATVIVEAEKSGPDANIILFQTTGISPPAHPAVASGSNVDALFDTNFSVTSITAGGGGNGISDTTLKQLARASSQGAAGPIRAAFKAYALQYSGVARVAAIEDGTTSILHVRILDSSWGGSVTWTARASQTLQDNACGFGERFDVGYAFNLPIRVEATVMLTDAKYSNYTADIDEAIRVALQSYFDDRDDWWMFRTSAVRAVISRADPRILVCTSATVKNFTDSSVIADPAVTTSAVSLYHYYFTPKSLISTYVSPT